jgi:16S rRNA G1207 methylase RsmC
MFNKFAKAIRWSILLGMLYTLYVVAIKDDVVFNNETDEKVLVEMAEQTSKRKEKFLIHQQLHKLYPENDSYQKSYEESLKVQADGLVFAHEKMLIPEPKGNYVYVEKVEFAEGGDGSLYLIFTMKDKFAQLDKQTQETLKSMFLLTHKGIYEHYGFDSSFKLLIVPAFDSKEGLEVMDLGRKEKKAVPQIPATISS